MLICSKRYLFEKKNKKRRKMMIAMRTSRGLKNNLPILKVLLILHLFYRELSFLKFFFFFAMIEIASTTRALVHYFCD